MNKYHTVKITVLGHVASGKSTYARFIANALSKKGIPVELKDDDIKEISNSLMKRRFGALSDMMKKNNEKVIIQTLQARRTEKIV